MEIILDLTSQHARFLFIFSWLFPKLAFRGFRIFFKQLAFITFVTEPIIYVMKLEELRQNYTKGRLLIAEAPQDPFILFKKWFDDAMQAGTIEPNAMVVNTCDKEGRLSSRVVLLKEFSNKGFVFYTNYNSVKGHQISEHPEVSLLFWWQLTERQVEIHGSVYKISAAESDHYFDSRPFESRIGAIVSDQSKVIEGDNYMDEKFQNMLEQSDTNSIKRPDHWGGFLVDPDQFRFWQGRPGRLHDRLRYKQDGRGGWMIERLAP